MQAEESMVKALTWPLIMSLSREITATGAVADFLPRKAQMNPITFQLRTQLLKAIPQSSMQAASISLARTWIA